MESRFEPAAAIRDVLMDSAIGLWCVELDKGKAPPQVGAAENIRTNTNLTRKRPRKGPLFLYTMSIGSCATA